MSKATQFDRQRGVLLIEMSLVILLIAVILGPVLHLIASQRQQGKLNAHLQTRQQITQAVEGFVLSHGRLPCPATQANGHEARLADACAQKTGWLPTASMALWGLSGQWKIAVATLEEAGEPAQNALVSNRPFSRISPQQLAEIILAPFTANHAVGTGPLPAIHLCSRLAEAALPSTDTPGCAAHTLLSPSAVWVAYLGTDQVNEARHHQFFINPDQTADNPVWLSFDRLNWLWMKRGSFDNIQPQEN